MGKVLKEFVEVDGSRTLEVWDEENGLHIVAYDSGAWEPEWGCVDLNAQQVGELIQLLSVWQTSRG